MKPTHIRTSRHRAAAIYVVAVSVAGTLVLVLLGVAALEAPAPEQLPLAIFLVLCLVVTELRPVSWITKRTGAEVTASWTFAFALMLVCPVGIALAAVAGASALSDATRGRPRSRVWFNAAQLVLALAFGAALLELLTGSHLQPDQPDLGWVGAAVVAAAGVFVANGVLVGLAVALHGERSLLLTVRTVLVLNVFTDGLLLAVAPILVAVGTQVPELVPLLFLTIWAVYRSACIAETRNYEAGHDLLTGLANRRTFQIEASEALRQAERRGQSLALVMIDLDLFKHINDELGHEIGDLVLQEVGQRLAETRRATDVVARIGGDEFGIVIRPVDGAENAFRLAMRVHDVLAEACTIKGFPVSVGASVGVALYPEHGADLDEVMRHADVAMYAAKGDGGGVRAYNSDRDQHRAGRLTLLSELAAAIATDQLTLQFQPKVDLGTLRVVGAEALVRWNHPLYGTITPDRFVPMAEQTELMHEFTAWVLAAAVRQCATWRKQGLELPVAVNVSAQNLRDLRFASRVAQVLSTFRVDATSLELELTENTVMSDPARAYAVLSSLRDMGIRLAIDDFGTGYSSLTSLRNLPIDTVKIDRSFIVNMASDAGDQAIVRAILDMARHFGLTTVAEGIESSSVMGQLAAAGCDVGQGFLFSPALPAQRLTDLVYESGGLVRLAATPRELAGVAG